MLLIDEIDKTDQEFEAMLLEVLSDFQISIPELGVVEARSQPLVLLTSNNSRELTEALKRRCLYLWLDYPDVERELEIVRLHAPELDEHVARKLVEVVHMVRALDLKKPPSIAESIDWARALLLLGAEDIDRGVLEQTMSDHRQAPHRPRPRGRARRREARAMGSLGAQRRRGEPQARPLRRHARAARGRPAWPRGCSSSPTSCATRAWRSERPSCSTRSRRSTRSAGPRRSDFREALAATLAKSQEDRHVLDLVFDRFFFRAVEREAVERGLTEERFEGGERLDLDELRERSATRSAPAATASCATSPGSRSPPSGARARARA